MFQQQQQQQQQQQPQNMMEDPGLMDMNQLMGSLEFNQYYPNNDGNPNNMS